MRELMMAVKASVYAWDCECKLCNDESADKLSGAMDSLEISFHAHIAEIKRRRSEGVFRNRVPLHPFYVERLGEWQCRDKDDKVFHVERGGRVDCEERCDAFNIYYGYTSDGKDILEGMEE